MRKKKNYFWIPYPMGYFSASSEPVLMQFQGFLGSKQVNSPHGVISSGHYSSTGLGVKRIVRFVETMIVDYPSLHFLVCYILLDGKQQKYEHFNTLGEKSYLHLTPKPVSVPLWVQSCSRESKTFTQLQISRSEPILCRFTSDFSPHAQN